MVIYASAMNRILVIGSTGNVGRVLVEDLARSGEPVRAATRNPGQWKGPDGVEPVAFDYAGQGTYAGALEGADRVFLIGPPDPAPHRAMLPFLEAAAHDGRKFVLMTAMGTEYEDSGSLRQVELAVERSGSPFVILRPNWFMDNFHTIWLAPIRHAGVIPLPAADARTSFIDARDIAASAAAALRTNRFDGQAFTLTGPEALTYAEVSAVLSKAAGREIRYVPVDAESFVKSLAGAGVPAELAQYLAVLFEFVRQGYTAAVSPAVEELTGQRPRGLAEYALDHGSAWS
jgi:uncharacterized protein YbjT (DUF2867 family)